ncbi:MAG TPA: hypothetical protein VM165_13110 [Planctomycetaceae bacterium]|nr:hypothetical protein [Planctomycetaceae bacterium]
MTGLWLARRGLVDLALIATVFSFGLVSSVWSAQPAPAHAHPEKGPHGGPLLELGDEEYHIEVMLDEKTNVLTLYLLDSAAKALVPTDAKEAVINLKHGGKPEQFKLPAVRQKTDPAEMASAFQLKDAKLMHDLHHKNHEARLAVKINGKSYTTKFDLKHDHKH